MNSCAQTRSKPRQQQPSQDLTTACAPPLAASGAAHPIMSLQRTLGNQAVQRLLQAKLRVGAPGDAFEQEADRASEQMTQPACHCGGGCPKCQTGGQGRERLHLQTKRVGQGGAGQTEAPPIVDKALASPSRPLDPETRAAMEPRFGRDFSGVRVHSNDEAAEGARAVQARAYTVGRDIVFGSGEYAPATTEGRRLLAHELAHVVQQGAGEETVVRRQTGGQSQEDLRSSKYAGNARLEAAFDNSPAMHVGETNDGVRLVQEGLVADGFPMPESTKPTGEMDGVFGEETLATVGQFQGEYGLSVDGVVGRETLGELDRLASARGGGDEPDEPGHVCSCPQGTEPVAPADGPFTEAFAPASEESAPAGFEPVADIDKAEHCPNCKPKDCPGYSDREIAESRKSLGRAERHDENPVPAGGKWVLMFDFTPGEAQTKPHHDDVAWQMVDYHGLKDTPPSAKVALMMGYTDCVDIEPRNFALRELRALAVLESFRKEGAHDDNLGEVRRAPPGLQAPEGDNSTAEGRARNRSVLVRLMPPTFPEQPNLPEEPSKRRCEADSDSSDEWSIMSQVSGVAAPAGLPGAGAFVFALKNCQTDCVYTCYFLGLATGTGFSASISAPGGESFTTARISPNDFEGFASIRSTSAGAGPVGYEHAVMNIWEVETEPPQLNIGGIQFGKGGGLLPGGLKLGKLGKLGKYVDVTGVQLVGWFQVDDKGVFLPNDRTQECKKKK